MPFFVRSVHSFTSFFLSVFISARRVAVWHGSWWNHIEPSKNRARSLRSYLSALTGKQVARTSVCMTSLYCNHQIIICWISVCCFFNHLKVGGVLQAVLQRDAVVGRAVLGWGSAITTQQTLWDTRYLTATSLLSDFKMSLRLSLTDRQNSN